MSNETTTFTSASAVTDTSMEISGPDPFVDRGSNMAFDFLDAISNPNADGALGVGAAMVNQVPGGPALTISAAGAFSNVAGKKGLRALGSAGFLQSALGVVNFRQASAPDHAILWSIWRKVFSTSPTTANYTRFFGLAPDADGNGETAQTVADGGVGGTFTRRQVGKGTGNGTTNAQDATVYDVIEQVGFYFNPADGRFGSIKNGVITFGDSGVTLPFRLQAGTSARVRLSGSYKQDLYRFDMMDITNNGRDEASITELMAWDYAYRLPLITAALAA
jgi:hypothetical protein